MACTGLCRRNEAMGIAQGPFIMPVGRFGHRSTYAALGWLCHPLWGHYADFPLKKLTRALEGRSMPRLDRTAQETRHVYSGIERDPQKVR